MQHIFILNHKPWRLFLVAFWLLTINTTVFAQEKKRQDSSNSANTREAVVVKRKSDSGQEDKKAERKHKPSSKVSAKAMFDKLEKEYKKRLAKQAKDHYVRTRNLNSKRNRDPSYFGHKRKLKRRKIGKRKLCKECGIVH